jgi:Lrp/AsnC family transcriptional regulator, regulator for asnA, asnC and gidA
MIDEIDRGIISILQRDGRVSNTEIGRTLGLTETTIRKRIARLVDAELVNIVAMPTPQAIGMTTSAIIGISIELSSLEAAMSELATYPEVSYVGASTGRYDLIIEAFFSDHGHLLEFVAQTLGSLDGVREVEVSLILRVTKFSYEWVMPPAQPAQ